MRDHFNPNAWHEIAEDIVVCRQRELHEDMVRAREMVLDKRTGLVRDRNYGMRLYEGESLMDLVSDAGFDNEICSGSYTMVASKPVVSYSTTLTGTWSTICPSLDKGCKVP